MIKGDTRSKDYSSNEKLSCHFLRKWFADVMLTAGAGFSKCGADIYTAVFAYPLSTPTISMRKTTCQNILTLCPKPKSWHPPMGCGFTNQGLWFRSPPGDHFKKDPLSFHIQ